MANAAADATFLREDVSDAAATKWGLASPPAPTVPSRRDARPGRRGSPLGRFREKRLSRGHGRHSSGVLVRRRSAFGVSPQLPSGPKPWRFAARQIRKAGGLPAPPSWTASLRLGSAPAGPPGTRPGGPPDRRPAEADNPPLRSSRAEARSCPAGSGPKPFPVRWQPAGRASALLPGVRRPEGPLPPGWPRTRRSAEPWALYEACRCRIRSRASPQLPPGGGFVSRPAFRGGRRSCLVGQRILFRSGCVLGRFPIRCRFEAPSATNRKLSRLPDSGKPDPAVDNEDSGHKAV